MEKTSVIRCLLAVILTLAAALGGGWLILREVVGENGLTLLEGWARDGLTDEQLAEKIGIGVRTLYDWKGRYPQISQALKMRWCGFVCNNLIFPQRL